MAETLQRLASARIAVEQSCQLLLTPTLDDLDRCSGILSMAVGELAAGRDLLTQSAPESGLLEQLRHIQIKVSLANHLLENAAAFHAGWQRILCGMVAGYTPHGTAASPARPGHLAVEG